MHFVIEVVDGPSQGKRSWLLKGQVLCFGRTHLADVAFPDDPSMSSRHFLISAESSGCRLEDLDSTNGTSLNGQFVARAQLGDGDHIKAGETSFVIHHAGGSTDTTAPVGVSAQRGEAGGSTATQIETSPQIVLDRSRGKSSPLPAMGASFTHELTSSGLDLLRGAMFNAPGESTCPSQLISQFGRRFAVYWIADLNKAGVPVPADWTSAEPLFDWLPADVARTNSPLILPPSPSAKLSELIDQLWDEDALVAFLAESETPEIVTHLKASLHFNLTGQVVPTEEQRGMLGLCWPSVLSPLLSFGKPAFMAKFLNPFAGVLVEVPDFPSTWQLFAPREKPLPMEELGFRKSEHG